MFDCSIFLGYLDLSTSNIFIISSYLLQSSSHIATYLVIGNVFTYIGYDNIRFYLTYHANIYRGYCISDVECHSVRVFEEAINQFMTRCNICAEIWSLLGGILNEIPIDSAIEYWLCDFIMLWYGKLGFHRCIIGPWLTLARSVVILKECRWTFGKYLLKWFGNSITHCFKRSNI